MRDVEFLPAWYARKRHMRTAMLISGCIAGLTSLVVIVFLSLR